MRSAISWRRRLLIGGTLLACLLSLATLSRIGGERGCGAEHVPSICNIGVCSSCRGATGSGMHALCGSCAGRRGCCRVCGLPLRSGLSIFASRLFANP